MMKSTKYTQEQIDRALELRETTTLSYESIGQKVGMARSSVQYYCMRDNAHSPSCAGRDMRPSKKRPYLRHGVIVRPFNASEDRAILQMAKAGVGLMEMSRRLSRAHNSVKSRLQSIERFQEFEACQGNTHA